MEENVSRINNMKLCHVEIEEEKDGNFSYVFFPFYFSTAFRSKTVRRIEIFFLQSVTVLVSCNGQLLFDRMPLHTMYKKESHAVPHRTAALW